MSVDITLVILLLCIIIHILSIEGLKRKLLEKNRIYDILFKKTSLVAVGIPHINLPSSLRLKYFFPFVENTKDFDIVELLYLYIARIAAWVGIFSLVCMFFIGA